MRKVMLDFHGLDSKKKIHEYLAKQMEFPEYYGMNLDALFDCLTDISEPTAIACIGMGKKEYLEKLQKTMEDAEEENRNLAVFFIKA